MSEDKIAYVLELTEEEALFVRDVMSQCCAFFGHGQAVAGALNRAGLWSRAQGHRAHHAPNLSATVWIPDP